jgi:hypothetical protein
MAEDKILEMAMGTEQTAYRQQFCPSLTSTQTSGVEWKGSLGPSSSRVSLLEHWLFSHSFLFYFSFSSLIHDGQIIYIPFCYSGVCEP